MNGIHDLGGMHGFGAVMREADEPVFHADWERRMFAMMLAMLPWRTFNVDEFRRSLERMPPAAYLAASYYERWLFAFESLLIEKGAVARGELVAAGILAEDSPIRPPAQIASRSPHAAKPRRGAPIRARFKVGDHVVARNMNPAHHTRLPRYARGKRGVIRADQGVFPLPDTYAHALGANARHVYTVAFSARELWGGEAAARDEVRLDLWEQYLLKAPAKK